MSVSADTASERAYLPEPEMLRDQLLLADAGYPDFDYFEQVSRSGGSFVVRGSKSLNPQIMMARNGQGKLLPKLLDKPLKSVTRRTNRSEVLDLICWHNGYEFRLIRRWVAEEKCFCIWLTNLPVEAFTANNIMDIYRCRWQIELLLKAAQNTEIWLWAIIENLLQRAWSETCFWLEKAQAYLCQNAFKTPQRKSCKNKTLDACFERLNS